MPAFAAATVTSLLPDCVPETFKLPRSWQALADHRQPVLKASASAWVLCCERGVHSDDVCVTDSTFTLTRAPSPALCPAADVILPPPHTHMHAHALPLSLSHYLPLFTFPFTAQKTIPDISFATLNTHTHIDTHINTGSELTLNANLTSSERCVGLHRLMCTHRAKSWNCVIAATHKHILLGLNKGAFRLLKQDGSSVSQLASVAPWLQTDTLSTPLLLWQYLFFCLNDSHEGLHGQCDRLPSAWVVTSISYTHQHSITTQANSCCRCEHISLHMHVCHPQCSGLHVVTYRRLATVMFAIFI